jgi:hypothetical protein
MLKKEISDVLKQIAIFTAFILILPAFLIITTIISNTSYFSVFFPLFQVGLLFGAFFMGASLFSVERGQRGMEYLLSLPFSRYKIIGLKILPRFITILIFYVVFLIFYLGEGTNYAALALVSFTIIYFSFFLISLSLSASSDNFLVLFVVSLLSLFIYLGLGFFVLWLIVKAKGYIYYVVRVNPFIIGELDSIIVYLIPIVGLSFLIPLLVAFGFSMKKFDIRPSRVYNKRFIKFFAPLFALGLLASFFFAYQVVSVGYSSYYLTRDHKLIEQNYNFGFRIYDGKNVHKIQDKYYYFNPAAEDNQYVYGTTYNDQILRIDTSDYSVDILYEVPKGKRIMWGRYLFQQKGLQKDENIIALLEKKRDYSERTLVLLILMNGSLKKIKRIPLDTDPVKEYYSLRIFATNQSNGNRFWLATAWRHEEGTNVFRLWEDGKIERIGPTQKFPFYFNGLLFTYSEKEIIISGEKEGKFETIRWVPNPKGYLFGYGYWRADLSYAQFKGIYGRKYRPKEELRKGPMWARLNLETFEIEEISDTSGTKGWLYCFGPDQCYFEDKDYESGTFDIYKFEDGQSKLIRHFRCSFEKTFYPYEIFESGIVLRKGKRVKVYAFPDLKEIKFKKL